MRMPKAYFAFTAWLLLVPGMAAAQTSAGSIAGTVRDMTGAVLPGVTVEASSPALIEKVRSVVTDDAGQYRIVDLRPGVYAVTFTLPGFETVRREGIELTTGFTAPVNVELRVGDVSETLTVSGQAPLVDVQNTSRQVVLTREVIDTLPTTKNYTSVGVLIPGMILSNSRAAGNSAQDGGGSNGLMATFNTGLAIHGGRVSDQQMQVNGMPIIGWSSIQAPANMMVDTPYQEFALDVSANAAEVESGGVRVNMIPRDGGSVLSGRVFSTASTPSLQATNITPALVQQGLRDPNRLKTLWQYSGALGGALVKDRVWFYSSVTQQRNESYVAGTYVTANLAAWDYTPDRSRQAAEVQYGYDYSVSGTWQATPRNKITGFWDFNSLCMCTLDVGRGTTVEASDYYHRDSPLAQATWSSAATNKLLLEAGFSRAWFPTDTTPQLNVVAPRITDSGLNVVYRNGLWSKNKIGNQVTTVSRGSASYVTGTHSAKVGFRYLTGLDVGTRRFDPSSDGVEFIALNGQPTDVIYYATPFDEKAYVRPMLGVYGQDQWTLSRLTMNLGVRFDYFRSGYPSYNVAPTKWLPVPRTVQGRVTASWRDLSPRLGASYDLFGNGKTALKVSAGRYVLADGTDRANVINPISANNSNRRRWTDLNNDRVVQGDPFNNLTNSELGPSTNLTFGQPASGREFDPAFAFGFGKRPYNWEFSANVQHEVAPRVSVSVGYFRRIFGNFEVTANRALASSDFDQYCVTTPTDPRLPGGGGEQICGLYDLKPGKVGQVQLINTSSDTYGRMIEHWNGVDFSAQARFPKFLLQGGLSTGRTVSDNCALTAHPEVTATVVRGSPKLAIGPSTPADFCHIATPFSAQTQIKMLGSYSLPWDMQLAGTFQHLPGPQDLASATFTSAQVASSLGRPLGGSSTVSVPIVAAGTMYGSRLNQFDVRVAKSVRISRVRLQGTVDTYNLLNSNTVTARSSTYGATTGVATGSAWLIPQNVFSARLIKFSVLMEF